MGWTRRRDRLAPSTTEDSGPTADAARPSRLSEVAISGVLAALIVATAMALGTPPHRQHERVGAALQRVLVKDLTGLGAAIVPGSSEHHTQGYADGNETCAAEASSQVNVGTPIDELSARLVDEKLPHVEAEFLGSGRYLISVRQTFGFNPFDWSCWQ